MEEFIRHYGLWAVYFGMWLEGETILVLAGFLASQGLFHRWEVLPVAILGALSVDHFVFLAGRHAAHFRWLQKMMGLEQDSGSWRARLGESWAVFLMVRFIYGTRTPYLFYIGTRKMSWVRFIARELGPVTGWCFIWLFFGHAIGNLLILIYGTVHHHQLAWTMGGISTVALGLFIALSVRRHKRVNKPKPPSAEEAEESNVEFPGSEP